MLPSLVVVVDWENSLDKVENLRVGNFVVALVEVADVEVMSFEKELAHIDMVASVEVVHIVVVAFASVEDIEEEVAEALASAPFAEEEEVDMMEESVDM